MPKKDTPPTPEAPTERKALTIELAPASAALLRRVSAKTGISQSRLRGELSRSAVVEKAVEAALRMAYDEWKRSLGDDLFGSEKGTPDA